MNMPFKNRIYKLGCSFLDPITHIFRNTTVLLVKIRVIRGKQYAQDKFKNHLVCFAFLCNKIN